MQAVWSEFGGINWNAALRTDARGNKPAAWEITASKMKMKQDHAVPLSPMGKPFAPCSHIDASPLYAFRPRRTVRLPIHRASITVRPMAPHMICALSFLNSSAGITRKPRPRSGATSAAQPPSPARGMLLVQHSPAFVYLSLSIDALCRGLGPKIIRLMLFQMQIGPGRTSPLGHTRIGRLHPNRQLAASGRREQA